jgi:hypothetical protein
LLLLCNAVSAAEPAAAAPDQALLDQARAVLEAQLHFDQAALDAMLAPGYVEVSPVGDVDDRAEVLGFYSAEAKARMLAGPVQPLRLALDDATVRQFGDHAIVIALDTTTLKGPDATREVALRVLFHFRNIDGRWLLQTAQFTPWRVKPAQPPK